MPTSGNFPGYCRRRCGPYRSLFGPRAPKYRHHYTTLHCWSAALEHYISAMHLRYAWLRRRKSAQRNAQTSFCLFFGFDSNPQGEQRGPHEKKFELKFYLKQSCALYYVYNLLVANSPLFCCWRLNPPKQLIVGVGSSKLVQCRGRFGSPSPSHSFFRGIRPLEAFS